MSENNIQSENNMQSEKIITNNSNDFYDNIDANIDIKFNKAVKKITNNSKNNLQFFEQLTPNYVKSRRLIRINNYCIPFDDDERPDRENYSCYSYQFERLLKNNNIDTKNSSEICRYFYKEKDNLTDLSWLIEGYY